MASIDEVVAAYRKLREQKEAITKKRNEETAVIREKMFRLENWLIAQLNTTGAESVRTEHGTVFKATRVSSKVTDWGEALAYIIENDLWHLLERRVAKQGIQEFEEAQGEPFPGVVLNKEITINVRK